MNFDINHLHRCTNPVIGIDTACTAPDIRRDGAIPWPEPDADMCVGSFHCIPAATDAVERGSVAFHGRKPYATSNIAVSEGIAIDVDGRSDVVVSREH